MFKINVWIGRWQDGKTHDVENLSEETLRTQCEAAIKLQDDRFKAKKSTLAPLDMAEQVHVWDASFHHGNLIAVYDIRSKKLTVL